MKFNQRTFRFSGIWRMPDVMRKPVEKYFQLRQAGKIRDQQRLLSKQRRLLLEALHANQRKIDNLDYLLYTLKTTPRSS